MSLTNFLQGVYHVVKGRHGIFHLLAPIGLLDTLRGIVESVLFFVP
jgi:hypothetical protein